MKMVNCIVKHEITGKVTLELTPQELATIVAAMGRTSYEDLEKSLYVLKGHLVKDAYQKGDLYSELKGHYQTVFGGTK